MLTLTARDYIMNNLIHLIGYFGFKLLFCFRFLNKNVKQTTVNTIGNRFWQRNTKALETESFFITVAILLIFFKRNIYRKNIKSDIFAICNGAQKKRILNLTETNN